MRTAIFYLLLLCIGHAKSFAQGAVSHMSMVNTECSVTAYKPGDAGTMKCNVQWSVVKNGKNMKIFFYAQNDMRNITMELTDKGKELPIKLTKKDNSYYTVFSTALKDIFYKEGAKAKYSWKWQGAAKAPASPAADVNGNKPKRVKYWFTVKVDGASFSTEPSYLDIK